MKSTFAQTLCGIIINFGYFILFGHFMDNLMILFESIKYRTFRMTNDRHSN